MTEIGFSITQKLIYKDLRLLGRFYRIRKYSEIRDHQANIVKQKGI
jgi:hypothetical protein